MMDAEFSFDEWVQYIFDNPGGDDSWRFHLDPPLVSDSVQLDYLTRLFENASSVLTPYSDAQVNNGLWFIGGSALGIVEVLFDEGLAWGRREQCIRAMYGLYADIFAKRCSPHLSHLDEPGANPLNSICYMWWDLLPILWYEAPFYPVGFEVMRDTLQLDSIACQEGALHGLGHLAFYREDEVAAVIDQFLEQHPNIRPELRTYALAARSGCIL
ncbi:MAG: hypothetical protein F9K46_13050 [Anaerolineae bacterium]|nr:MAG: hypothetical protein F9K46_13050 [Anaerolineae bacterium]